MLPQKALHACKQKTVQDVLMDKLSCIWYIKFVITKIILIYFEVKSNDYEEDLEIRKKILNCHQV